GRGALERHLAEAGRRAFCRPDPWLAALGRVGRVGLSARLEQHVAVVRAEGPFGVAPMLALLPFVVADDQHHGGKAGADQRDLKFAVHLVSRIPACCPVFPTLQPARPGAAPLRYPLPRPATRPAPASSRPPVAARTPS